MLRLLLIGTALGLLGSSLGGCNLCPPFSFDCNWPPPPPPPDAGANDLATAGPPTIPGCQGSCKVDYRCPAGHSTTLAGTVTIPAGTLPLPGVQVAIPTGSELPGAPGAGPACDPGSAPELATFSTRTDVYGNFNLSDIPSGDNIPLVIRTGKWQRVVILPRVVPCARTMIPAELTHLPRNQREGNIPQIALSTGGEDALECLLRGPKLGLDDAEFTPATGPGRVHLYAGATGASRFAPALGGASFSAAQALPATSWYDDPASWNSYDLVMLSCEGGQYLNYKSPQAIANLEGFLNKGGRVLATHLHNGWLQSAQPPQRLQSVATFGTGTGPDPVTALIDLTTSPTNELGNWLNQDTVLGSPVAGQLQVRRPGYSIMALNSSLAQSWISYQPAVGAAVPQAFSFAAPVSAFRPKWCGKMVFSDFHASSGPGGDSSAAGTPFPGGCTETSLSPQEKAMLYLLFDLNKAVAVPSIVG